MVSLSQILNAQNPLTDGLNAWGTAHLTDNLELKTSGYFLCMAIHNLRKWDPVFPHCHQCPKYLKTYITLPWDSLHILITSHRMQIAKLKLVSQFALIFLITQNVYKWNHGWPWVQDFVAVKVSFYINNKEDRKNR